MEPHELLTGLDDHQQQAVTSEAQPLGILAGAGSGKTRVLTRRIAFRCAVGDADPRHVLAITFTRKAANELTSRLKALGFRDLPTAGTFHSVAYTQLRHQWTAEGREPPTLLEGKHRTLAGLMGRRGALTPAVVAAEIEWAKARMIRPDAYAEQAVATGRPVGSPEQIAQLYQRYEEAKDKKRLIDFDDLLHLAIKGMRESPATATAQLWRFRHLFVDEFQDVNTVQFQLLQEWLGTRNDLCVVGDPNQAIYSWNGADPSLLANFTTLFPGAEIVALRDNYRSSPQILAVAASVLAGDGGVPKPLRAHQEDEPVPTVVSYEDEVAEANGIARAIRDLQGPRIPWSSQAVLVRTNAQTVPIEAALRRAGIPYRVRDGSSFLEDFFVKGKLRDLRKSRLPFTTELVDLTVLLDADDDTVEGERRAALETLISMGTEFAAIDPHARASAFPEWLAATIKDEDAWHGGQAVEIATFHAAKGLEWPVVHLAGVESGYVPISYARTPDVLDEERRLFYVAVTRAERLLRCTYAEQRTIGARTSRRSASPYLAQVLQAAGVLQDREQRSSLLTGAVAAAEGRAELRRHAAASDHAGSGHDDVLAALRAWRHGVARGVAVADQVILPDQTLAAVAQRLPHTTEELASLPGVGPIKLAQYGPALLDVVASHRSPT